MRKPGSISIPEEDIVITAMRSQGAGGQNVNKVSSAVHLRYDIRSASLPEAVKTRLLALNDRRITKDGVLILKAQTHRSQDRNRNAALHRLQELVDSVSTAPEIRRPTKPSHASTRKRLDSKRIHAQLKQARRKPD